jgi:hypothetical protein
MIGLWNVLIPSRMFAIVSLATSLRTAPVAGNLSFGIWSLAGSLRWKRPGPSPCSSETTSTVSLSRGPAWPGSLLAEKRSYRRQDCLYGYCSGAERSVWDAEDHVQPATASDFDEVHFLGP